MSDMVELESRNIQDRREALQSSKAAARERRVRLGLVLRELRAEGLSFDKIAMTMDIQGVPTFSDRLRHRTTALRLLRAAAAGGS